MHAIYIWKQTCMGNHILCWLLIVFPHWPQLATSNFFHILFHTFHGACAPSSQSLLICCISKYAICKHSLNNNALNLKQTQQFGCISFLLKKWVILNYFSNSLEK
jgi:hypothetical protein